MENEKQAAAEGVVKGHGTVTLCGQPFILDSVPETLLSILARYGVDTDKPGTAVAHCGRIIPRESWGAQPVHNGDTLEVLIAMAGG